MRIYAVPKTIFYNFNGGNMLRRLATMVVVLVVVGGNVYAAAKWGGIARQIAMGGSNAGTNLVLNPFIMEDPALVLLNPAYQAMYKDYAWMNIGGGTEYNTGGLLTDEGYGHQNAGLAFGFGRELAVGAILSYDPSFINAVSGASIGGLSLIGLIAQRPTQLIPPVANVWEVVGSYQVSGMAVGLGVMYGNSNSDGKFSTTTPAASGDAEASASVIGFRAGVNADMGSGSSVDASAALRLDNVTDKITQSPTGPPTDGEYSASGTELTFAVRAKFKASNRVNFVPYAFYAMLSAEPKEDVRPTGVTTNPPTVEVTASALAVGVGGEYRTADFYLAGGLSFQRATAELKVNVVSPAGTFDSTTTVTYQAVPVFNIGGEWWLTDWLAGRAGYYRSLGSIKNEGSSTGGPGGNVSGETNLTIPNSFILIGGVNPLNHDGIVTLGLGFKFGNFSLDATVSEQALRRGLGLIGSSDNINTFGFMNASYNFE